jgi:hypothetical protein
MTNLFTRRIVSTDIVVTMLPRVASPDRTGSLR